MVRNKLILVFSKNGGNRLHVLLHSCVKSWDITRKNNIDFAVCEIGESFYSIKIIDLT